ncbi:methionine-tRNA ligase [Batrachochytrium salamandrivorans]|nr:methionine-tRNA ligase [Batrachochytrium salamandrivorans]
MLSRFLSSAPVPAGKKQIITTPLFYVNSKPHLGHAYSAVLTDAMARWESATLVTGTDEHGQKISSAALGANLPPQQFCDTVSSQFRETFDRLDVDYDYFIRTTEVKHRATVEAFWSRISKHITLGHYEGWYCASDEAFVADKLVDVANKQLKDFPHAKVEWVAEPNYKFNFNPRQVQQQLFAECQILPGTARKNEVAGYLADGNDFESISVSRPNSRVPWALTVPGDSSQSIYVWLEALCGYITASGCVLNPDPNQPAISSGDFSNVTHVIGKDILKFHTMHWPAFLLAAGLPLPKRVIAHAHWTVSRCKMSKSLGNVIDPNDLLIGLCKNQVDALRYFLLRDGRLETDADFSPELLMERVDNDLANNLGNLLNRACADSMWKNLTGMAYCPVTQAQYDLVNKVDVFYRQGDFAKGLELLMQHLNETNARFQNAAPWVLAKSPTSSDRDKLKECLGSAMGACHVAAVLLRPVTPQLSSKIFTRLGLHPNSVDIKFPTEYAKPIGGGGPVLFTKLAEQITKVKR